MTRSADRLREALTAADSSVRLQTALAAGTRPDPAYVGILVARCAVEPDFFVRDMLTWALMRHPADATVPLLLAELRTGSPQARSQALHTLSKIGDPRGWAAITPELLQDPADQVARSAWRAAVVLVPQGAEAGLAAILLTQLGRGDRTLRLSLSQALAGLGEAAEAGLAQAAGSGSTETRIHAVATQRLALDPLESFDTALFEAELAVALGTAAGPDADPPAPDEGADADADAEDPDPDPDR